MTDRLLTAVEVAELRRRVAFLERYCAKLEGRLTSIAPEGPREPVGYVRFHLREAADWAYRADLSLGQFAHAMHGEKRSVPLRAERRGRAPIPAAIRRLVLERDGYACVLCGSEGPLHIDHVHPVARGGETTPRNLRVLCADCNLRKGASAEQFEGLDLRGLA